jgi:hypothetical protein
MQNIALCERHLDIYLRSMFYGILCNVADIRIPKICSAEAIELASGGASLQVSNTDKVFSPVQGNFPERAVHVFLLRLNEEEAGQDVEAVFRRINAGAICSPRALGTAEVVLTKRASER